MKSIIRKILLGNATISEYSTVTVNEHAIPEKVYLQAGNSRIDISSLHWILCLEPLVFGVWLTKDADIQWLKKAKNSKIYFTDHAKKIVAVVTTTTTGSIEENDGILFLLTLQKSRIFHINFIKAHFIFERYYKKPGLSYNKLKAFAAAYSYPRKVRVVSYKDGDYFNIFPMDLVGDISQNNRFVFGLRHTNVTLKKIIGTQKLVISEVPFTAKPLIYELGKHHSSSLLSATELPFGLLTSHHFKFPVPGFANAYKEIRIIKNIDLGSHMLLWGEVLHSEKLNEAEGHLFHIHFLHYLHQKNNGYQYRLV